MERYQPFSQLVSDRMEELELCITKSTISTQSMYNIIDHDHIPKPTTVDKLADWLHLDRKALRGAAGYWAGKQEKAKYI